MIQQRYTFLTAVGGGRSRPQFVLNTGERPGEEEDEGHPHTAYQRRNTWTLDADQKLFDMIVGRNEDYELCLTQAGQKEFREKEFATKVKKVIEKRNGDTFYERTRQTVKRINDEQKIVSYEYTQKVVSEETLQDIDQRMEVLKDPNSKAYKRLRRWTTADDQKLEVFASEPVSEKAKQLKEKDKQLPENLDVLQDAHDAMLARDQADKEADLEKTRLLSKHLKGPEKEQGKLDYNCARLSFMT